MNSPLLFPSFHGCRFRLAALLAMVGGSLLAAPPGPTPQVPDGGQPPGPFPNESVTAINVIAQGSSEFGFDGRVEIPGIDGQGPIPWSINRYNRGDIALRLSPNDPEAALDTLNQGFIEFADDSPGLPANHTWRPTPDRGVSIPTARQNGPIDWGDNEGPFFPTVALSTASSGPGYHMLDGSFGTGDLDINLGRAGTHASSSEANFSFSTVWFPYDQGWLGGDVGGPTIEGESSWKSPASHATGLAAGMVRWLEYPLGTGFYGGLANLTLPGVNSLTDGMLFTTSSDGSSDIKIIGAAPGDNGSGWLVTIREDSAADAETLVLEGQSEFQFVYVPYDALGLIGGHINGANGSVNNSAGEFTLNRTGTGAYTLAIPGKSGSDGTLLLQAAGEEAGTSDTLASRAFLSYEFLDGTFRIQSRKTTGTTTADLADSDFYFAWVDFETPFAPPQGPTLRHLPIATVNDLSVFALEASLAINTDEPEVLVTTIDSQNAGGYIDPITQQFAASALTGYFYDPRTLAPTRDPFIILGNPTGGFTRHDVKYNPVSRQYVVVANARTYGPNTTSVPLIALVNPHSVAGEDSPVADAFAYDPETTLPYDDVSVAVSSSNGNFLLAAERNFTDEGEGTVGVLFDQNGTLLTPQFARLDRLQPTGDEDDPDVVYLEGRDVFFYIANTDLSGGLQNRLVGAVIQTVPDAGNALQVTTEQPLGDAMPAGVAEGHPSAIENPFNGEILTAYDVGGNGVSRGDVSFSNLGQAPDYTFTTARAEIPYLDGADGTPFRHNHPQLAVDSVSGAIAVGFNASSSEVGYPAAYAFTLLDPSGAPLPGQLGTPWFLAEAPNGINTGPNLHNLKYSPQSQSFIAVFNTSDSFTYIAAFEVTSRYLSEVEPPDLQIRQGTTGIDLLWPSSAVDFELESTPAFNPPDWNWTVVTDPRTTEGELFRVTVPAEDESRFFRLRR